MMERGYWGELVFHCDHHHLLLPLWRCLESWNGTRSPGRPLKMRPRVHTLPTDIPYGMVNVMSIVELRSVFAGISRYRSVSL